MKPRDIDNASAGELEQIEEATGRMTREPLEKLCEAVYAAERRVSEYSDERQAELESAARATIRAQEERKWEQVEFHLKILEEIIKEYDTRLCMPRTTFRWAMILTMILSASFGVAVGSFLTVLIP